MALLAASILAGKWGMGKHIWATSLQKIVEMKRVRLPLKTIRLTYTDFLLVDLICLDYGLYFRAIYHQSIHIDVLSPYIWDELDDLDLPRTFSSVASWEHDCASCLSRADLLFLE